MPKQEYPTILKFSLEFPSDSKLETPQPQEFTLHNMRHVKVSDYTECFRNHDFKKLKDLAAFLKCSTEIEFPAHNIKQLIQVFC